MACGITGAVNRATVNGPLKRGSGKAGLVVLYFGLQFSLINRLTLVYKPQLWTELHNSARLGLLASCVTRPLTYPQFQFKNNIIAFYYINILHPPR
jgi:hypothetical protein